MSDNDQSGSLKSCLEESNNPRMQNYVKILDTPDISAMEWIHRTQEELMDGIVYLEKLKNVFSMNMRELDAAARMVAQSKEAEKNAEAEKNVETETVNITVPAPVPAVPESENNVTQPKKKAVKSKVEKGETNKDEKPKKKKTKIASKEEK